MELVWGTSLLCSHERHTGAGPPIEHGWENFSRPLWPVPRPPCVAPGCCCCCCSLWSPIQSTVRGPGECAAACEPASSLVGPPFHMGVSSHGADEAEGGVTEVWWAPLQPPGPQYFVPAPPGSRQPRPGELRCQGELV